MDPEPFGLARSIHRAETVAPTPFVLAVNEAELFWRRVCRTLGVARACRLLSGKSNRGAGIIA